MWYPMVVLISIILMIKGIVCFFTRILAIRMSSLVKCQRDPILEELFVLFLINNY